jgi:Oxidoreductase family, NAD-binding Rossmann fold
VTTPMGVAVVGAGYWGPNLMRNFLASPDWDLRWAVDLDPERAHQALRHAGDVRVTQNLDEVLDDPASSAGATSWWRSPWLLRSPTVASWWSWPRTGVWC